MSNYCCLRGMKNLQVQLLYGWTDGQWRHDRSSRRLPSARGDGILPFLTLIQHSIQIVQFSLPFSKRKKDGGQMNPSRPWNRRLKMLTHGRESRGRAPAPRNGPVTSSYQQVTERELLCRCGCSLRSSLFESAGRPAPRRH